MEGGSVLTGRAEALPVLPVLPVLQVLPVLPVLPTAASPVFR